MPMKKHTSQNGNFDMAKSTSWLIRAPASSLSMVAPGVGIPFCKVSHSPNLSQHMEENPHET